jgi:hypothetical protein
MEVAKEHEQQRPGELGEADCGAVGAEERQVGHRVTNTGAGHHISSWGGSVDPEGASRDRRCFRISFRRST